ncbi:MAG: hypothetical protein ABIX09_01795 [Terrimesophilobacter sp.]
MPYQVTDSRLNALYGRSPQVIAYLDEAYETQRGRKHFYIMSALIIQGADRDRLRTDFINLVGGNFWHTTSSYGSAVGRQTVKEFVAFLAQDNSTLLCVVDVDLDRFNDAEAARRHCFSAISTILDQAHRVDLIVFERRRAGVEENADNATVHALQRKHSTRDIRFHPGTPTSEPLLWGPDVVASVFRRRLALGNSRWFEPIRTKTIVRKATTGEIVHLDFAVDSTPER